MDAMDIDAGSQGEAVAAVSELKPQLPAARPTNALANLMQSDSEPETEEAPVQKPRGKLLAQFRPQIRDELSESEEEDAGAAYERVKKMLLSSSGKPEPMKEVQKEPEPTPTARKSINSDEEDHMPVRATTFRRLSSKRAASSSRASPRASPSPSVRSRRSSPGLFVTPEHSPARKKATVASSEAEDEDEDGPIRHNKDLTERIQRIRAERLAAQKEKQSKARPKESARTAQDDSESDSDGENGRRLTQQARPTRRAGKKAMEDIAREQQRIQRNMQLTHQAKTKKKYGVKDMLSKFGLAQVDSELVPVAALPTPDASSALHSSDGEATHHQDTPPTSPANHNEESQKKVAEAEKISMNREETHTSDLSLLPVSRPDKGKGRAADSLHIPVNPLVIQSRRAEMKEAESTKMVELSDSEDDMPAVKQSRFPVFDRIPQQKQRESSSLLHLRHLAHVHSPPKKVANGRKTMNMTELQFTLAQKARQQAMREREEKIADLRRRGIHIETEEEREKHQMEIEDMVALLEKQRQEDLKLAKLEKKEAKANGEKGDDLPSSDEDEDEDYVGSGEEEAEVPEDPEDEAELELSGSEEEDMGDDEEADDEEAEPEESNDLVDDAAAESEDAEMEETTHPEQLDADDEEGNETPQMATRKVTAKRQRNIVMDDEDEESGSEAQLKPVPTQASQTQQDDAMAAFGFNNVGPLGLTQMFAGTMANLASESQNAHPLDLEPEQDSLAFLRSLPDTQPQATFGETPTQELVVPNSQLPVAEHNESHFSLGISQLLKSPEMSRTQVSEVPSPTQDAGFELSRSPAGLKVATIDTVMMGVAESPLVKRKGRLHQRKQLLAAELSDVDEDLAASGSDLDEIETTTKASDAFSVLKKAAKKQKRIAEFNKKTSWARDAIEEQAEESEDEYAGIGGASDEESDKDDEELREMIDESDIKVDERKIAAYFAEKDKKDDKKNINQLYKDIMNGGLRKRRGGDAFDVSDPEDEVEQRKRRKRMQFQQMTKALMADERVGQIAQNPKKAAFFQTLADHLDDPDNDFLDAPEPEVDPHASPSQSDENKKDEEVTEISVPDSQAAAPLLPNPLKRKAADSQEKENRPPPPPHHRRTAAEDSMSRKPMTIADVQHSVLELLEDSHAMVPESQYSDSDSELEIEPPLPASKKQIIDRLGASRQNSMTESSPNGHLAFVAPAAGAIQPGFRVPSLIRRATSNLSAVSTSTSGSTTPVEGSGVRRGGTGRSNIHAQAREAERRAALEKVEMKRKETLKKKVGKARGKRSVLGCLDAGFE